MPPQTMVAVLSLSSYFGFYVGLVIGFPFGLLGFEVFSLGLKNQEFGHVSL